MKKVKKVIKEDIPILKEEERLKDTKMSQSLFDKMLKKLSELKVLDNKKS